jgi:hypothetical protein
MDITCPNKHCKEAVNKENYGLKKLTIYSYLTGTENPTHAAHTAVDS